ncbi:MAG: hypothetical protein KDI90_06070 [Alphaproteobacteria bacterium]|nr:hypothetical protein [Alphaproteobacteria bacterium]MCB9974056.1 hypothetical protein [Rhodospirillales bacterium]
MLDDEISHDKYLASYMIDAWRRKGGPNIIPASIHRDSFCGSPEVTFAQDGQELKFFFGRTPFNSPESERLISDKWDMFRTLQDEIPLPHTEYVSKTDPRSDVGIRDSVVRLINAPEHPFSFPLVVKPSEGSLSCNVHIVKNPCELERAIFLNRTDMSNGPGILFQEFLGDGRQLFPEIRGVCLDGEVMIAYDRVTQHDIPDDLLTNPSHWPGVLRREVTDPKVLDQIQCIAEHLYDAYGLSYVAFDMKCDKEGRLWVLEGNVAPLGLDEVERQLKNGPALVTRLADKMFDKVLAHKPELQLQMAASMPAGGPQMS